MGLEKQRQEQSGDPRPRVHRAACPNITLGAVISGKPHCMQIRKGAKWLGVLKPEASDTLPTSVFSKGKWAKTGEKDLTAHQGDRMGFRNLKASQDDMINMEFGCHAPYLKLSKGWAGLPSFKEESFTSALLRTENFLGAKRNLQYVNKFGLS